MAWLSIVYVHMACDVVRCGHSLVVDCIYVYMACDVGRCGHSMVTKDLIMRVRTRTLCLFDCVIAYHCSGAERGQNHACKREPRAQNSQRFCCC